MCVHKSCPWESLCSLCLCGEKKYSKEIHHRDAEDTEEDFIKLR